MPLLTSLPRDVVGEIVRQAALQASKADVPASAICAWMRRFCTSARMQGVACDDYWYKLALAAFGVDPDAVAEPPPKWLRGVTKIQLTWREFFSWVCDAFFFKPESLQRMQEECPELFVKNATQRQLDEGFTALVMLGARALWVKRNYESVAQGEAEIYTDWERVKQGKRSGLLTYTYWPMMALLLLRGAEVGTKQKYRNLDGEIWRAITLSDEDIDTDEAIARIADAVDRGADINVTNKDPWEDNPRVTFTLRAAIQFNNPAIIQWLLDHGAKPSAPRRHFKETEPFLHFKQLLRSTVYHFGEWKADYRMTTRLVQQMHPFFQHLKDTGGAGDMGTRVAARLAIALTFMADHGWADDYYFPENVGDIVDVAEYEGEQVGVGARAKVFELWNDVFDRYFN